MAQLTLACALQYEAYLPRLDWRPGHPKLVSWLAKIAERPSIAVTAP